MDLETDQQGMYSDVMSHCVSCPQCAIVNTEVERLPFNIPYNLFSLL